MAIRFIFGCMMFLIVSFAVVPVLYGIAGVHAGRVEASMVVPPQIADDQTGAGMSFEEIYTLANNASQDDVASVLNNIAPGAGGEIDMMALEQLMAEEAAPDAFSKSFSDYSHPAL